jgi:excisionase family DNA binding protein
VPDLLTHCLTPRELARRWRTRPATVRAMIRRGTLAAIAIGGGVRIPPESIAAAESEQLAVRPVKRRKRETIPREIVELLDG